VNKAAAGKMNLRIECNIKTDFKEVMYESVDWPKVAHNRVQK
jgi:hypothetical protein